MVYNGILMETIGISVMHSIGLPFFFFSRVRKQQKILECFLEDKLSTIYLDLQIQCLLMHVFSFRSIRERLKLL